jgi:predicted aspartyl protease
MLPARLPLTDTQGFLTVPASINGVAVSLLLDTGADTGLITPQAARLLHLPADPGRRSRMQGTGGDGAFVPHAKLAVLALGGLRLSGLSVPVAPLPSYPRLSPPIAGLLGGDILSAFTVDIDLALRALALEPPAPPAAGWLPAERDGNRLSIAVQLEGQGLRALLDTGARSLIVAARAAARLGITPAQLAADPGGITSGVDLRPVEFHWHRFDALRIGAEVERNVTLTVAPLDETADMLLGAPFFAAHRVMLSYAPPGVQVLRY